MKILLLYTNEKETPNQERVSSRVLKEIYEILSFDHEVLLCEYHSEVEQSLRKLSPDLIFNMAYGYLPLGQRQSDIVELLEKFEVPFLGTGSKSQRIAEDKCLCKKRLQKLGFDVPQEVLSFPAKAILKKRYGACHRNLVLTEVPISFDSKDYLLEEYVEGKEYTVGVLDVQGSLKALPPGEVIFAPEDPKVLGLNQIPAMLNPAYDRKDIADLAKRIHRSLGLRHYSRIDFREDKEGVKCLDVNCLPNLDREESFLPTLALFAGMGYEELIHTLLHNLV